MSELISVIAPLYDEEAVVHELVRAVRDVMEAHHLAFELILVDDGSKDGTYAAIREEAAKDDRVVGLRFRCNCGQTAALRAGFDVARGDVCVTMDGDLQHDPKYIPELVAKIREGQDIVCSYRFQRRDAFLRRFPSRVANAMARGLSGLRVRDFGSTYRAYRTAVVKDLPIYGEMHRFVPVFVSMMTDRIAEVPIQVKPRPHGRSKYGLGRAFRVVSDLVVLLFFAKFFDRPIHIFGYFALGVGIPGVAILACLTLGKLFAGLVIANYGPLFILGVLLTSTAAQLFTTGIVCEYLIRVYYNSERRTSYSIAEMTRNGTR
jgi:glycosyltransferase involved in cell wall biosynthesis